MGDSRRNSKRNEGCAGNDTSNASLSSKKCKIADPFVDFELETTSFLAGSYDEAFIKENLCSSSERNNFSGGDVSESCEMVDDSLKVVDREANNSKFKTSTCVGRRFSRETTPPSQQKSSMDSPPKRAAPAARNPRRKFPATKSPAQVELDEFFAVGEKYDQKRFSEKYNFDIVKDEPLEGRYQWVRLKP